LAAAGGFDCFSEYHRAQYFNVPEGEMINGLEKIIKYGQVYATQNATATNTLFGDLPISMEIPPPRIIECPPWPLIVQLDREKEVTGIFLSGHPLDNYKFEMKHYGVTPLNDFNEFKEAIKMQSNPGRPFRIVGLVADAQHRIAKSGNKYGNFVIEDYSGKTEFPLFSEDYMRLTPILQQGSTVLINGYFKPRYNKDEFEFKVMSVSLAETMKRNMTKAVTIEAHPQNISAAMVNFVEKNVKTHPGNSTLKFTLTEPKNRMKISLVSTSNGFEMNEEMIHFLEKSPELEVQVQTL
jgi:DNA polymerase III subunit alpha